MSLIDCPECNNKISDKAISCPGCGCPSSEIKKTIVNGNTNTITSNNGVSVHNYDADTSVKTSYKPKPKKNNSVGCGQTIVASMFIIFGAVIIGVAKLTFNFFILPVGMIIVIVGLILLYFPKR
jgi:hypothetical protein